MKRGSYPRLFALDLIEWAATAMSTADPSRLSGGQIEITAIEG
jgi:hypothetical protein